MPKQNPNNPFQPTHAKILTPKQESTREKEMDKELKKIYKDDKGKMPNLTKLDFIPKHRKRNLIIGLIIILFLLLAASIAGFWFFQTDFKFSGNKILLEIKTPLAGKSGDKINYQIKFSNNEGVSLTKITLTVNLPQGFIFTDSNLPEVVQEKPNPSLKTWQINDLGPGQNQEINLNGILTGTINSQAVITATLSYTPANFNSEFQKNATATTAITDSLLSIDAQYPAQVADGEITELDVKIANKSTDTPLSNLEFDLNFPAEFSLLSSQLLDPNQDIPALDAKALNKAKPDVSPKIISLASLAPQEKRTLVYRGKFSVPQSQESDLTLQAKVKGTGAESYLLNEAKITPQIIKGELLNTLIIQGSDQDKPVNLGDTLNYLMTVENKSQKTFGDVKVRAVLDSLFLDWNSLSDKNKGMREDNQILWTKDQIPALASLAPNGSVEIAVQIKLKNLQDVNNYKPEDLMAKSFFETQVNKMNDATANLVTPSNTITNEFNTNLALQSVGRYFGDHSETLGSGPLPPIVGQKTTYRIFWTLTNSLHEITNIEIKAKLPTYINFEDQQNLSTGTLLKNQNNEIVWQISRIPISVDKTTAEFSISLTPASTDVQKILSLIQDITVTATDSQTKGQITLTLPGLTTNLDSDPLGKGKGLIQAE